MIVFFYSKFILFYFSQNLTQHKFDCFFFFYSKFILFYFFSKFDSTINLIVFFFFFFYFMSKFDSTIRMIVLFFYSKIDTKKKKF